MEYQGHCD